MRHSESVRSRRLNAASLRKLPYVKTRQHDLAFASRGIGAEGGEDVADLLVLDGLGAVSVPGRR